MIFLPVAIGAAHFEEECQDQSHHQPINTFPLDELVVTALHHLEKLGYSRRSLRRYRGIWNRLVAFSHEHDLGEHYSSVLAERFVEAVGPPDGIPIERCVGWRRHAIFGIRVLDDFVRHAARSVKWQALIMKNVPAGTKFSVDSQQPL